MVEQNPWNSIPVRMNSKIRLVALKCPKENRKKGEHFMETLDDVIVKLLDFWDNNHGPT